MKGFKPTGYGPSAGFKFPQRMGFTGSTGAYTNVSPYVRRKFANGGSVRSSDPGGSTVNRKKTYAQWQSDTGSTSSLLPGYARGGRAKMMKAHEKMESKRHEAMEESCMKKADGGPVDWVDRRYRVPRRYSNPTVGEGLRAIPPLAKEMAAAMTRGTRRAFGPKERRFGVRGDLASNYAKGGKAKRMGYANGGGRRDGAISGAVSASEAKKIAERTVGDHVRYPAPKGHKGLEKAMRR